MSRTSLDVTKTLYDSDGYRHTLVRATPVQILTLVEGFYWLWDRRSGRCLVEGMASHRLSNTRPPGEDLKSTRDPVAETRAFFMAQKAMRSAAASATAVLARASTAARSAGTMGTAGALPRLAAPVPGALPATGAAVIVRPHRRATPAAAAGPSLMAAACMVGLFALTILLPGGEGSDPRY